MPDFTLPAESSRVRVSFYACGTVFLLLLAACSGATDVKPEPETPASAVAIALEAVEGDSQTGTVGQVLPTAVSVRVLDQNGRGVSGLVVRFAASQGSGSISPETTTTDASGTAQARWTLGTRAGGQSAEAAVGSLRAHLTATARPGAPVSLEITPTDTRVIRFGSVQLVGLARDAHGNVVEQAGVTWRSENEAVATISASGLAATRHTGTASITAHMGDVTASASITAYTVANGPIDAALSAPAPGALWEVPVAVIRYLPTTDGTTHDTAYAPGYWDMEPKTLAEAEARVDRMVSNIKFGAEEASRFHGYSDPTALPSLGYKVVAYITVYEPAPAGRMIYTAAERGGLATFSPDYHAIFERLGVADLVNNRGVREIWFFSHQHEAIYPSFKPGFHTQEHMRSQWESNMSSPTTGDISNSNLDPDDLPVYDHTYTVYGIPSNSAEEGWDGHLRGHQLERMFSYVNWLQDFDEVLFWKSFAGCFDGRCGTGRAGSTHVPPNTTVDYDYDNLTLVESDIMDWTPDNSGKKTAVNSATWKSLPYAWPGGMTEWERPHHQWLVFWMQNMPGRGNTIRHGDRYMTNWWEFVAHWDRAIREGRGLYGSQPALR